MSPAAAQRVPGRLGFLTERARLTVSVLVPAAVRSDVNGALVAAAVVLVEANLHALGVAVLHHRAERREECRVDDGLACVLVVEAAVMARAALPTVILQHPHI